MNIPVIDLQQMDHHALDSACREWGFFLLTGHGISGDFKADVLNVIQAFFTQPKSAKNQIRRTKENCWGYFDAELTKNRQDWKEIFDFGRDQDDPRFDSTSQWPQLPHFRETMMAWFDAAEKI